MQNTEMKQHLNGIGDRLLGALDYACLVDDISEETDRRIRRLIWAIRKKYFI